MTKQTIEVPDGYKIKSDGTVRSYDHGDVLCFNLEKIQPRRIVLEETCEERSLSYGDWYEDDEGNVHKYLNKSFGSRRTHKVWTEVKETDIPLTNEENYLKLSVDEAKKLMRVLEGFNVSELSVKVHEFIKDK